VIAGDVERFSRHHSNEVLSQTVLLSKSVLHTCTRQVPLSSQLVTLQVVPGAPTTALLPGFPVFWDCACAGAGDCGSDQ
jgi:hypothetical protein